MQYEIKLNYYFFFCLSLFFLVAVLYIYTGLLKKYIIDVDENKKKCLVVIFAFIIVAFHFFRVHEFLFLGLFECLFFFDGWIFDFGDFGADYVFALELWWSWRRVVVGVIFQAPSNINILEASAIAKCCCSDPQVRFENG